MSTRRLSCRSPHLDRSALPPRVLDHTRAIRRLTSQSRSFRKGLQRLIRLPLSAEEHTLTMLLLMVHLQAVRQALGTFQERHDRS